MISALRLCPRCGAEIPADAPEGGCPGCLLETGLGLPPDARVTRVDDPGRVDKLSRDDVALAPKKSARAAELLGELGDYELLEEVGRRSGRSLSRPSEKFESHGCAQGYWPGSVGHRSAPEAFSPGSGSCRESRSSAHCPHLRSG